MRRGSMTYWATLLPPCLRRVLPRHLKLNWYLEVLKLRQSLQLLEPLRPQTAQPPLRKPRSAHGSCCVCYAPAHRLAFDSQSPWLDS